MGQIISFNARGLGDPIRRRTIFNYYRKRANLICLQETHSTTEVEKIWEAEWGGSIVFAHGTSNARGVCILIDNSLPYRIVKKRIGFDGRYITCEFENIDNPSLRFTLCNIYAPNTDSPQFFVDVNNSVNDMSAELILLGDFNLVMNEEVDRIGPRRKPRKDLK